MPLPGVPTDSFVRCVCVRCMRVYGWCGLLLALPPVLVSLGFSWVYNASHPPKKTMDMKKNVWKRVCECFGVPQGWTAPQCRSMPSGDEAKSGKVRKERAWGDKDWSYFFPWVRNVRFRLRTNDRARRPLGRCFRPSRHPAPETNVQASVGAGPSRDDPNSGPDMLSVLLLLLL